MSSTLSGLRICPRRGFSLIEAAIVLGVIGLVIGGIWIGAEAVNRNIKMNNTFSGLISGVQEIRRLYKDVSSAQLIAAQGNGYIVTPDSMAVNPFGFGLDIQIYSTADGDAINVSYYDVTPEFCMQFLPRLSGQAMVDEIYGIYLPDGGGLSPPFQPTLAQCTGSDPGGTGRIQLFFKK